MIDIDELRRLAQAATPGPWINHGRQPNVAGLPHSAVAAKTLLARVYSEAYGDVEQETANASLIAAANPAAITELLDRLEAAESDALEQARLNGMGSEREAALMAKLEVAEKERDELRADLDALKAWKAVVEAQKPVGYWDPRDDMYFLPGFLLPHSEAKMEPRYTCPVPAQSVPDVDYIVDKVSEFGDHNVEHGRISFDKWTLREAVESALAAAPKPEETK